MSSKTIKPDPAPKAVPSAKPQGPNPGDVLVLFAKNLQAIREWYRSAPGRGVEIGHYMVGELATGEVLTALQRALEGKTWDPPEIPKQ